MNRNKLIIRLSKCFDITYLFLLLLNLKNCFLNFIVSINKLHNVFTRITRVSKQIIYSDFIEHILCVMCIHYNTCN